MILGQVRTHENSAERVTDEVEARGLRSASGNLRRELGNQLIGRPRPGRIVKIAHGEAGRDRADPRAAASLDRVRPRPCSSTTASGAWRLRESERRLRKERDERRQRVEASHYVSPLCGT